MFIKQPRKIPWGRIIALVVIVASATFCGIASVQFFIGK
jgi:hypothetical protein